MKRDDAGHKELNWSLLGQQGGVKRPKVDGGTACNKGLIKVVESAKDFRCDASNAKSVPYLTEAKSGKNGGRMQIRCGGGA